MRIIRSLDDYAPAGESYVTIGNFDGMHAGHKELVNAMLAAAKDDGKEGIVVTFAPHPAEVLSPAKPFQRLISETDKLERLQKLGVKTVLVVPFTEDFARLSAEEFVRDVLVKKLNARRIFVGHDWKFGRNAGGDFSLVRGLGSRYGFRVEKVEPVHLEDAPVSSTRIREALKSSNIRAANAMLGGYFAISGTVVKGFQRGRTIGFPTANIVPGNVMLPAPGGYLTWAEVDGKEYPAMTNIGTNPTFGNDHVTVETHIPDFDKDIYGKTLTLHFVDFLAPEQKFPTIEALTDHLHAMERQVRARLGGQQK